MNPTKGYFSIVQFCPNPSRVEAVNIGVLLFCPEIRFIASQVTRNSQRVKRFFGPDQVNIAGLASAKLALQKRLEVEQDLFRELSDLQRFVDTRSNAVQLTDPRPVKVFDPQTELQRLFDELVGGRRQESRASVAMPELDTFFAGLVAKGRATRNAEVTIPVMGIRLSSPYAYRNGALNLVKPQMFSLNESSAIRTAGNLAIEGDLLRRHTADKLVVVTAYESLDSERQLQPRIQKLFSEYKVTTVDSDQIAAFMARVELEAH